MAGKIYTLADGRREFDSHWLPRSDATNVHLGTAGTKNVDSNCEHGLGLPLEHLDVLVYATTDVTDPLAKWLLAPANVALDFLTAVERDYGVQINEVSENAIRVQTGLDGVPGIDNGGNLFVWDTEDFWYRIIITERRRREEA